MLKTRFLLMSLNVVVLLFLGMYILDLFSIKSYEVATMAYLLFAAIAVTLIANEFVDKFSLSNPIYFIVPAVVAIVAPLIIGKPISAVMAIGWMMLAPGMVMIVRSMFKENKKQLGNKL